MSNPLINLLRFMWKYSAGNRQAVVIYISLSIIANIVNLAEPLIFGRIFNDIQFSITDARLLNNIFFNLGLLVAIVIVFWIFHGISRVIEVKNAFLVRKNYKLAMLSKVLDLPTKWHKDHHSGDTIDKVNKAADALYGFSAETFNFIKDIIRLVGSLAVLTFFDWRASIIAVIGSVVAMYMLLGFDRKLIPGYKKLFKMENFLASAVYDYISNVVTVITLRLKKRAMREVRRRSLKPLATHVQLSKINEWKWFSASFLVSLITVVVLMVYAHTSFTTTGAIMIGTLFTLYRYLQNVGNTFYSFAWQYGEVVHKNAALEAAEVIVQEYKKLVPKSAHPLPHEWQHIAIRSLTFKYDAQLKNTQIHHIENISLELTRGKNIAFIGKSGSGKSTVLALLRGLYTPRRVEVTVDGARLEYGLAHMYNAVTLIPQDPEIFNSTIKDNITMDTRVTHHELKRAIAIAEFTSVPKRLKKGLRTNVMEKGVSLSGGEKQRLALARGVLAARDSDFLFLDEPTSSVDATTEMKIYENIFSAFPHATIISSVHRLHLLRFFDYVYFFRDGKVFSRGTFEELLKNYEFKQLWDNYTKRHKYT